MMIKHSIVMRCLLFGVLMLVAGHSAARADTLLGGLPGDVPVRLTAEEMRLQAEERIVTARGNVTVRQGQMTVRADWMRWEQNRGVLLAGGGAVMEWNGDRWEGESIRLDLHSGTGEVLQPRLEMSSRNLSLRAEHIIKTGERDWRLQQAELTTCRCPSGPPSWSFGVEHADLTVEGYAYCEDVTLKIRNRDVFYLPYLILPVKTQRASGLLLPTFGWSNRRGFEYHQPIYWAPSAHYDATLTPRLYSELGLGAALEQRYAASEALQGEATLEFLQIRGQSHYWALTQSHGWGRERDTTVTLSTRLANRPGYFLRLRDDFEDRYLAYEPARLNVRHRAQTWFALGEAGYYLDRVDPLTDTAVERSELDSFVKEDYQVQQPRIRTAMPSLPLFDGRLALRGGYEGVMNHERTDGVNNGGQRHRANVRLAWSERIADVLEWNPVAFIEHTAYHNREDGQFAAARRAGVLARGAMSLQRIYGLPVQESLNAWRHRMELSAEYRYIDPWDDGRTHDWWDETDTYERENQLRLIFSNLITARESRPEGAYYWELLNWRIWQDVRVQPFQNREEWPPLRTAWRLIPWHGAETEIDAALSHQSGDLESVNARGLFPIRENDLIEVDYHKVEENEDVGGTVRWQALPPVIVQVGTRYDLDASLFLQSDYAITYRSICNCWEVSLMLSDRFRPEEDRREFSGHVQFALTGIGEG